MDPLVVPQHLDEPARPFARIEPLREITLPQFLAALPGFLCGVFVGALNDLIVGAGLMLVLAGVGLLLYDGRARSPIEVGWAYLRRGYPPLARLRPPHGLTAHLPAWLPWTPVTTAPMVRAVARVDPLILGSYDPRLLLANAARTVRALDDGARLRLVAIGQSQDTEALVVQMAAQQRACPPELRAIAAARRSWYRTTLSSSYVPDLQHYLVLEASDAAALGRLQDDVASTLGVDMDWLEGEDTHVVDPPVLQRKGREPEDHMVGRDGRLYTARTMARLPHDVRLGWVRPLLELRCPFRLDIVIEPTSYWSEMRRLGRRIDEHSVAAGEARSDAAITELRAVVQDLACGATTLVRSGVVAMTWAQSPVALAERGALLETALRTASRFVGAGRYDQGRLLAGDPPLHRTTAEIAAAAYPWQRPAPGHTPGPGALVLGEAGGALVHYNPDKAMTGTMAIIGTQGSGKSYFAQGLALQQRLVNWPLLIIDSSGSWSTLVRLCGGTIVPLAQGGVPAPGTPGWDALVRADVVWLDNTDLEETSARALYDAVWLLVQACTTQAQARGVNLLLCIDEAWDVFRHGGEMMHQLGRKARHKNMRAVVITQQLSDMLDHPDGVKFLTGVPLTIFFRTEDERLGHGAGLAWIDRIHGAGTAAAIGSLRKREGGWSEFYMSERDPAKSARQRAVVRNRGPIIDRYLFGSYAWERALLEGHRDSAAIAARVLALAAAEDTVGAA